MSIFSETMEEWRRLEDAILDASVPGISSKTAGNPTFKPCPPTSTSHSTSAEVSVAPKTSSRKSHFFWPLTSVRVRNHSPSPFVLRIETDPRKRTLSSLNASTGLGMYEMSGGGGFQTVEQARIVTAFSVQPNSTMYIDPTGDVSFLWLCRPRNDGQLDVLKANIRVKKGTSFDIYPEDQTCPAITTISNALQTNIKV